MPDLHAATYPDPAKNILLVEHDEAEGSVKLLVREFLQSRENEKFGYFVYLIFGEQTQATYNKRLAASQAFMCQYSTRSRALDLGLKKSSLAAFTYQFRIGRIGTVWPDCNSTKGALIK